MYMKLRNPGEVREQLARKGMYTYKEIAAGCDIAETAARHALKKHRVWRQTVEAIAKVIEREAIDIAEIVE